MYIGRAKINIGREIDIAEYRKKQKRHVDVLREYIQIETKRPREKIVPSTKMKTKVARREKTKRNNTYNLIHTKNVA